MPNFGNVVNGSILTNAPQILIYAFRVTENLVGENLVCENLSCENLVAENLVYGKFSVWKI